MQSTTTTSTQAKEPHCIEMSYASTGRFSSLVLDYQASAPALLPYYTYKPDFTGMAEALQARKTFSTDRSLLTNYFKQRYNGVALTPLQQQHLHLLEKENTFTITTAHQPNIFTGPLYFLYKIIHAIKLADNLTATMPDHHFVPVFYMGSEDADLDELGHCYINSHRVDWQTNQVGAVGRMHTRGLEVIVQQLENWLYDKPFAGEVIDIFKSAYTTSPNVQEATFQFVNELFASFGLLIIVPDDAALKKSFEPWIRRELLEQFSGKIVQQTNTALTQAGYQPQASGRQLNLFYLNEDGRRERIELEGEIYSVPALDLSFNQHEILQELANYPERFSGNVILRGLFQEHILPNLVFIGGGGEIAYWLQLKSLFEEAGIFYPVLMLRNSFALMDAATVALQHKLALTNADMFKPDLAVSDIIAHRFAGRMIPDTQIFQDELNKMYGEVLKQATQFDSTLYGHVAALHTQALKDLRTLNKKYKNRSRKIVAEQIGQWRAVQRQLFPLGGLQERIENFIPFYAEYGPVFLRWLYAASQPKSDSFCILHLPLREN